MRGSQIESSQFKPPCKTPVANLWLCCMAQVYPEDRGMNYAIAYGQKVAAEMIKAIKGEAHAS